MLRIDIAGGIGRLTLDRPEIRNAFDDALIGRLTEALRRLVEPSCSRRTPLARRSRLS